MNVGNLVVYRGILPSNSTTGTTYLSAPCMPTETKWQTVSSKETEAPSMIRDEDSWGTAPAHHPSSEYAGDSDVDAVSFNRDKHKKSVAIIDEMAEESHKQASLKRKVSSSLDCLEGVDGLERTNHPNLGAKRPRDSSKVPSQKTLLLAMDRDSMILNPLHTFVRQQIEVFTATKEDISIPAPGRKNSVSLHQVGLRCIHCRNVPFKQRVKRAVVYPSSVGRVYHSVSDMKHDHFKACPSVPQELRQRFMELKDKKKAKPDKKASPSMAGCSSSTAQYYHDAACEMGMIDGGGGVFFDELHQKEASLDSPNRHQQHRDTVTLPSLEVRQHIRNLLSDVQLLMPQLRACQQLPLSAQLATALQMHHGFLQHSLREQQLLSMLASRRAHGSREALLPALSPKPDEQDSRSEPPSLRVTAPVGNSMDSQYLNTIHCFVRRHLEYFVATTEDVNAPSPGRKVKAVVGQVGIRCIHCARLSSKDRVKRSVCYPPSIGGIYHAVSNMKCDHFAVCKGLPLAEREEYLRLRASSTRKGSKKTNNLPGHGFANATAQYYHDCALRMGLHDTEHGIRLGDAQSTKSNATVDHKTCDKAVSAPESDGISALVIAASDLVSLNEKAFAPPQQT